MKTSNSKLPPCDHDECGPLRCSRESGGKETAGRRTPNASRVMEPTGYRIAWRCRANDRRGMGTKVFGLADGEAMCAELNDEHEGIEHKLVPLGELAEWPAPVEGERSEVRGQEKQ